MDVGATPGDPDLSGPGIRDSMWSMSDTKDVLNDARVRLKKLAASMLAQKESLEAQRKRLVEQGSDAAEIELRTAQLDEQIAVLEGNFADTMKEMAELGQLEKDFERKAGRALIDQLSGGTAMPSAVETTLQNVREHIENLEALAELSEPPRRASAPAPAIDRASADDRAREELEDLKTRRKKGEGGPKRTL